MLVDLSTSPIAPPNQSRQTTEKQKEPAQDEGQTETVNYSEYMFEIAGIVDGIAEEFVPTEGSSTDINSDEEWELKRIVVEVKNRSRAGTMRKTPGIHEQIQLVMYLHMLGLDEGDLIQYMRERTGVSGALLCSRVSIKGSGSATAADGLNHAGALETFILPRLYRFARMVMAFREDDGLRYRFLGGDEQSRRAVVMQFCPDLMYSGSRAWTNNTRRGK